MNSCDASAKIDLSLRIFATLAEAESAVRKLILNKLGMVERVREDGTIKRDMDGLKFFGVKTPEDARKAMIRTKALQRRK